MIKELKVCLEVGKNYQPKAQYSISMLLRPLGLGPKFCCRNDLNNHGLYYGHHPEGLDAGVIILSFASEVEDFFEARQEIDIKLIKWNHYEDFDYPIVFSSEKGDDLIASTFFWLSGWQEFTVRARDRHGRFPYHASLQSSLNIAHIPVVDIHRAVLQEQLSSSKIPVNSKPLNGNHWIFCPTIDVDYLKHWRLGMMFREKVEYFLFNNRNVTILERCCRYFQFIKSYFTPGDAFQKALSQMHKYIRRYGCATVFLKTGAHGPNDVHYQLDQSYVHKMVRDLKSDHFEIGLHSSYHAYDHPEYLRTERKRLTNLIGDAPSSVRNHYLRYAPIITAPLQSGAGFRIDATLGFAESAGFRNGTCMPFLKFDCLNNKVIDLWELPLIIMDGALFNRQKFSPDEAVSYSQDLLLQCKKFGGIGVVLWHNVMGEEMDYYGWNNHFEQLIEWAHQQGAHIDSLKGALETWLGHRI